MSASDAGPGRCSQREKRKSDTAESDVKELYPRAKPPNNPDLTRFPDTDVSSDATSGFGVQL